MVEHASPPPSLFESLPSVEYSRLEQELKSWRRRMSLSWTMNQAASRSWRPHGGRVSWTSQAGVCLPAGMWQRRRCSLLRLPPTPPGHSHSPPPAPSWRTFPFPPPTRPRAPTSPPPTPQAQAHLLSLASSPVYPLPCHPSPPSNTTSPKPLPLLPGVSPPQPQSFLPLQPLSCHPHPNPSPSH